MVKANLLGRCLRTDRDEFVCMITVTSHWEMLVRSDHVVSIGEGATLCVDQLGVVHGHVTELHEHGFSFETQSGTPALSERVARPQALDQSHLLPERRGEPRVDLGAFDVEVDLASGPQAKVLNLSATGAEIATTAAHSIGSLTRIGRMLGRVVRRTATGIGIEFVDGRQSLAARLAEVGMDLKQF